MLVLLIAMGLALFSFGCGFVLGIAYGVDQEQQRQKAWLLARLREARRAENAHG